MSSVRSVKLKLAYSDATSQTITFNDVGDASGVKSKVKAINANMPAAFAYTFISKGGAPCTMISQAQIVVTSEEVVYNAS